MADSRASVVVHLAGAVERHGAGGEDLADPVGGELEEGGVGDGGHALFAPTGEVGHKDLTDDVELGFGEDDPTAR